MVGADIPGVATMPRRDIAMDAKTAPTPLSLRLVVSGLMALSWVATTSSPAPSKQA